MAKDKQPAGAAPRLTAASDPAPRKGFAESEGGRGVTVDPSPEARAMHTGTVTTSQPAALPPDMERDADLEEIDNRAAREAALDVRRREHSAD
jgi:hypothetical protein